MFAIFAPSPCAWSCGVGCSQNENKNIIQLNYFFTVGDDEYESEDTTEASKVTEAAKQGKGFVHLNKEKKEE